MLVSGIKAINPMHPVTDHRIDQDSNMHL